jgi:large subunit ribosomal protein L1
LELVAAEKAYALPEAVTVLQQMPRTKFNETVELSVSLNLDPKKTDQLIRGTVVLPHGTGRTRRVLVFCKGEKELLAKQAGADHVGGPELVQKILDGWMDFDVVVATPDLMRDVSRLGKLLGPRGMMPNPKAGTVTDDVAKAVADVKRGKIEFKMDKLGNLHLVIGKASFTPAQLAENGQAALEAVARAKPGAFKGRLIRRVVLASTMSAGIPLATGDLEDVEAAQE